MARDADLEILIKLRDEASQKAKEMAQNLKGTFATLKEDFRAIARDVRSGALGIGEAIKSLGLSIGAALASINPVILALAALVVGIGSFIAISKWAVPSAIEFGNAMSKLSGVAVRFNQDVDEAKEAAVSLSEDGLISVATAAEGLARLLSTGLNLNQSIKLMESYRDMAALGRSSSIDMNTAVLNLAQSFVTERSQLADNSGMWENYVDIIALGASVMGRKVSSLNNAERALAKYTGTLLVSQRAEGDAQRMSETYQGSLARLSQSFFMLKVTIGTALVPILNVLANVVTRVVNIIRAVAERFIPDFVEQLGRNLVEASTAGVGSMEGLTDAMGELGGKAADTARKVKQAMADFAHDMAKVTQNFKRRLADLVFAHRDKVAALKKQIEEEKKNLAERIEKMKEPYLELKKTAIQAGKERLADLKAQLDKEIAKGKNANWEKVRMLQDFIAEEKDAIATSIKEWDAKMQEEIAIETEKGQAKIAELQKELNKEESILRKHRGIIATIKHLGREDDIAILIRQNNERRAEMSRQHARELANIRRAGAAQGASFGAAYIAKLKEQLNKGAKGVQAAAKKPLTGIKVSDIVRGAIVTVRAWWNTLLNNLRWIWKGLGATARRWVQTITGLGSWVMSARKLQAGGIVTKPTLAMIGERGPEAVVPLTAEGQRGARSEVQGMLGGPTININNPIFQTPFDLDLALERAALIARRGAR